MLLAGCQVIQDRIRQWAGCSERSDELSDSIKTGDFFIS
jgi:hypothetical protein